MSLKSKIVGVVIGWAVVSNTGLYLWNKGLNNRFEKDDSYLIGSEALYPLGKVEYTKFSDGNESILEAPRVPLMGPIEISRNHNGDNKIDIIRVTSSNLLISNRILIRGSDYGEFKEKFDKKDNLLGRLREKYGVQ
jgi:hypothetical protein